jgi:hypothetical protein
MTTVFVDESGTDTDLTIAVVAGLTLDRKGLFWLNREWENALNKHGITGPIHMREFTPHGRFKSLSHDQQRALFKDLVRAINSNKLITSAATLTADDFRAHFDGLTKLSMYAACFSNLMMLTGEALRIYGPHRWPLSFVLDDGNPYKSQIVEGSIVLLKTYPLVTAIVFRSDDNESALQAADVVSWGVRRKLSGGTFKHGFEPLEDLFDPHHLNFEYKEEWMRDVAATIRAAEARIADNPA